MRARLHLRLLYVLVAGFGIGASTDALAAPISLDNNVDLSWSQVGPEACEAVGLCETVVPVFGAPRLVLDASDAGNQVFFDIDVVSPQLFVGMTLLLNVGDASLEEIIVGGTPLQLRYDTANPAAFQSLFANPVNGVGHARILLSEFENFNLLSAGTDITFNVIGTFRGSSFACSTCGSGNVVPYGATVTVNGAGTPVGVPEPATSLLLLTGIGTGFLTSRRHTLAKYFRERF